MQNNGNFEKIVRTYAKPAKQEGRQAQPTGKTWKREDKRSRYAQA